MNNPKILILKITEDEYYHIQRILSHQMKSHEYDVDDISWYDFKYISQALEYARKEGETNENDQ